MPPVEPVVCHESERPLERWGEPSAPLVSWRTLLSAGLSPSAAPSLGIALLPAATTAPAAVHRHEAAEVYYVVEGEGRILLDGVEHPLSPGSAVFIPGGCWHAAWCTGPDEMRLVYAFAVDDFDDVVYEFSPPPGPPEA